MLKDKKDGKGINKIYLIKNIAPWMVDELLCYAEYTTFSIVLLRQPPSFYKRDIENLKAQGVEVQIKPFKNRLNLSEVQVGIQFILTHWKKLLWGYNAVIGWKSLFWFLRVKKDFLKERNSLHAQFATQASLISFLLKKYDSNTEYHFTFHAYDIFFKNKWFELLVENCETAFSISDYNIKYIKENYKETDLKKITLSRLGVRKAQEASKKKKEDRRFVIGFLSWFVEKKGIDYLLKAMKDLPADKNIKLLLAGDGPEREKIVNFIRENNLGNRCNYLGAIRDTEKDQFFKSIDAFILPSIHLKDDQDGIPVVLMEAISYGLPIISTNISGIPEICVDHYNGLLIKERDVKAIRDSILFLAENKEEREKFSDNSYTMFDEYNIEVNSKKKMKLMGWIDSK